jgi:hypothetical protein
LSVGRGVGGLPTFDLRCTDSTGEYANMTALDKKRNVVIQMLVKRGICILWIPIASKIFTVPYQRWQTEGI